ncbi:hypothetical protein Cni_G28303 [Canna indica]|uniref:Uncharacterized protein n=1 Tax=Canna indica TaxID=4628 RepID=A0AAQ3L3M3_9LILI|nr:hypothetical protein Cni_G28303 [Canna indica]
MRLIDPSDSPQDLAAAFLSSVLLVYSAASAIAILRVRRLCRRRLHDLVNPLWLVRLLLPLFASIWSIAELLRLPILRRRLPRPLQRHPDLLCDAHLIASQALAEPAFLTVLLFLIRASIRPKPASSIAAFGAAFAAALLSALPFLVLHAFYLSISTWDWRQLRFLSNLFGITSGDIHSASSPAKKSSRCSHPLFGTVLLAALAAVYIPVFVSASWGVVSLVINRRLRARLYVLCATVVGSLSVQVATLAISTLWSTQDPVFQWLSLAAVAAVMTMATSGQVILVVRPIIDALALGDVAAAPLGERRSTCMVRVQDVEQQPPSSAVRGSTRAR